MHKFPQEERETFSVDRSYGTDARSCVQLRTDQRHPSSESRRHAETSTRMAGFRGVVPALGCHAFPRLTAVPTTQHLSGLHCYAQDRTSVVSAHHFCSCLKYEEGVHKVR